MKNRWHALIRKQPELADGEEGASPARSPAVPGRRKRRTKAAEEDSGVLACGVSKGGGEGEH